jgi:hypothetical protein
MISVNKGSDDVYSEDGGFEDDLGMLIQYLY